MGKLCSKCFKKKNNQEYNSEKGNESISKIEDNSKIQADLQNIFELNLYSRVEDSYFSKEELLYYENKYKEEHFQKERTISKYIKGELLGEGSFGKVYQAFNEEIGELIAIKEIDIRRMNSNLIESKISSFEQEIKILSKLNHKNIIKYYGTNRTKQSFHIFLEFCIGGSIAKMLETYKSFSENVIRKYVRQILEGLEYLHAHNIIHRDIKGANILVDRDGVCKLSDFGGAKVIAEENEFNKHSSFKGTPNWMAPETMKLQFSRFSDIWSLGCTIIEMATGEPPWSEYKNPMITLYNLMHTNCPPTFPSHLSNTCKHFLCCCLKINPQERFNVFQLLKHPFLAETSPSVYSNQTNIFEFNKKVDDSITLSQFNSKNGQTKDKLITSNDNNISKLNEETNKKTDIDTNNKYERYSINTFHEVPIIKSPPQSKTNTCLTNEL